MIFSAAFLEKFGYKKLCLLRAYFISYAGMLFANPLLTRGDNESRRCNGTGL